MFTDVSDEPTALLGHVSDLWMFTDVSDEPTALLGHVSDL